jgi:hypothetical protein
MTDRKYNPAQEQFNYVGSNGQHYTGLYEIISRDDGSQYIKVSVNDYDDRMELTGDPLTLSKQTVEKIIEKK